MLVNKLHKAVIAVTCNMSGFETKRDYISISGIWREPDAIVHEYLHGAVTDTSGHLKCYRGYAAERAMLERLKFVEGYEPHEGIVLPGYPLIKGHPDFKFFGMPSDYKSYALDEHLPSDHKTVGKRIFWQMHGYMVAAKKTESYLLCESLQSGKIKTIEIKQNEKARDMVWQKAEHIYKLLNLSTF